MNCKLSRVIILFFKTKIKGGGGDHNVIRNLPSKTTLTLSLTGTISQSLGYDRLLSQYLSHFLMSIKFLIKITSFGEMLFNNEFD